MDTFKMMASNVIYAAASGRIKLSFDFVGGDVGVLQYMSCVNFLSYFTLKYCADFGI